MRVSCGQILSVSICLVIAGDVHLQAATPRDNAVELKETFYRVNNDNSADITTHIRVKALTAQGRANLSQILTPYNSGAQDVEIKYFKTLKKDGRVVAGDPSMAIDRTPSADPLAPYFSDLKYKTIVPPNLETGDGIEYEAVLHVRKWPKANDFWMSHDLTTQVAVASELVVLDLPVNRKVAFYEDPLHPGRTEIVEGRRVERWSTSASDSDAEKANENPKAPLFVVSSVTDWNEMGDWIESLNKPAREVTPEISALATKLVANKTTEQEKIAALYSFVATKVRYIGIDSGFGLKPHAAATVLNNGYGDCKDQSALLSALLSAAGFKGYPVLANVGGRVRVPSVPFLEFNHEFTAVETRSGLQYLDTSMGPAAPQVLPIGLDRKSALLIRPGKTEIVELPTKSAQPTSFSESLKGSISAAGVLKGSARYEFGGLIEVSLRRTFIDGTAADKEKSLKQLAGSKAMNTAILQLMHGDPTDLSQRFWITYEFSNKDFFPPPQPSTTLGFEVPQSIASISNQMPQPRDPVPMEAAVLKFQLDLSIDPALLSTTTPAVHLKNPFGRFDLEYSFNAGHVVRNATLEFTGTPIPPTDWNSFVQFFTSAQAAMNRGFKLERNSGSSTTSSTSELTRLQREGSDALNRRDYQAAKKAFVEVVKLDPQSKTSWNNLGRAYSALRDYPNAEKAYLRQIEINPNDQFAYNNLGIVYGNLHREDEGIALFHKAIEINPKDPFAHDNLGIAYGRLHRWEDARKEQELAVQVTPTDALKWLRLGIAQLNTRRVDEGRQSLAKALEIKRDGTLDNGVAYALADAGIDLDRAWQLISGAMESAARQVCQPDRLLDADKCTTALGQLSTFVDTAAWVRYRQGDYAGAAAYQEAAYAVNPRASLSLHLSVIYTKLGRIDEALGCFAKTSQEPFFDRIDSAETRRELAKAVGGEDQLETRLKQAVSALPKGPTLYMLVLVDGNGKVREAKSGRGVPAEFAKQAETLTLPPMSFPGFSLRSIRTLEFREDGGKWVPTISYIGAPLSQ
jgi:tetratricopeptide (TPR) repeat protein